MEPRLEVLRVVDKPRRLRVTIALLHPQKAFLYGIDGEGGYLGEKRGKREGSEVDVGGLRPYRFTVASGSPQRFKIG